jgi:hypothetical protein
MGEIFKPEDLSGRKPSLPSSDIPPRSPPLPQPSIQSLYEELKELRREIEKIKSTLRVHGIPVD